MILSFLDGNPSSIYIQHSTKRDSLIVDNIAIASSRHHMRTPVTPTATPVKMPESSAGLSPEIRYQMENAGAWTPVRPTTTPKTSDGLSPDIQSQTENVAGTVTSPVSGTWLSPKIKYQIENASPATARHVALTMYKSLKGMGCKMRLARRLEERVLRLKRQKQRKLGVGRRVRSFWGWSTF